MFLIFSFYSYLSKRKKQKRKRKKKTEGTSDTQNSTRCIQETKHKHLRTTGFDNHFNNKRHKYIFCQLKNGVIK